MGTEEPRYIRPRDRYGCNWLNFHHPNHEYSIGSDKRLVSRKISVNSASVHVYLSFTVDAVSWTPARNS
jgi:hypothetical protein